MLGALSPTAAKTALRTLWENRDALPYAARVLTTGVCDRCTLGPRGLADDVLPGPHLCTRRLEGLRDHTRGPLVPADLTDIDRLRRLGPGELRALGRVPYPFVHQTGDRGFTRVSWDEALSLLGQRLAPLQGSRTAWLAHDASLTNEVGYALAKAARLFGSPHVDSWAGPCQMAAAEGLSDQLGVRSAPSSLSDLVGADLVLVIGADPSRRQPVLHTYLRAARSHGTRVVTLRSRPSPTDALADDIVSVNEGGLPALLAAAIHQLLARKAVDRDFTDRRTTGLDTLQEQLDGLGLDALLSRAGVRYGAFEWLVDLVERAQTMVSVVGSALTRHGGASAMVPVIDLHLLRGAIGRPRCGILPVSAHASRQGLDDCGVHPSRFPGGIPIDRRTADALGAQWGAPVSDQIGLDRAGLLDAALAGRIDWLYEIGETRSGPEPDRQRACFQQIQTRVVQTTFLHKSALEAPGELLVLLPAQTRHEQRGGGTTTSVERRLRFTPEVAGHPQIGEARPGWQIPAQIVCAARPDLTPAMGLDTSRAIRDEMGRVIPQYAGIERLTEAGDWLQWGGMQLCRDGFENLPDGRAIFRPIPLDGGHG